MPAAHAFCTISKLARPLAKRARSTAGSAPSSSSRPTTLSTALWRPMSSRTTIGSPRRSHAAAACTAPVRPNKVWAATARSGSEASTSSDHGAWSGSGSSRARSSSIAVEPHMPQDDVVVPTTGRRGRCQAAGVDLDDVELGVDGANRSTQ